MTSPYAQVGERLIDAGYSAIPVMPGEKRPGSISNGQWYGDREWNRFCDRLPTEFETKVWTRWPDAGVCIALDKTIKVIDVDTDDPDIRAAIMAVLPPPTVTKRGKKGFSAFYRGSDEIVNRPFNLVTLGGFESRVVDLLAYGRQTVLPPTIHPETGAPYVWEQGGATLLDTSVEQLPELPDNVAELIAEALRPFGTVPEFQARPISGVEVFGETVWREANDHALANLDAWVPLLGCEYKRNRDGTYRVRAEWRGVENANVGVHSTGITDWGASKAYTPIDLVMAAHGTDLFETAFDWLRRLTGYETVHDEWMERAQKSAKLIGERSRQKREQLEKKIEAVRSETAPEIAELRPLDPIRAPRSALDPFTPESAGGLLGAISQWSLDTSRRPVPEFSVLSAISFISALFGRRCVGPTGAGLNLYLVGIAGPGFGKEHAHKSLQTLAMDSGFQYLIGPGEVTSGSAIEKVVRRRPSFVMPWDEMGVVLQSVNGFGSSAWAKTIRKVLLEVYSKSTSVWSGKEHADPLKDSSAEPIHCPTVSLLGMSTPTTFYKGLTDESLSDGFIARLTVIEAKKRPERIDAPPLVITPASLIEAVKAATRDLPQSAVAAASARDALKRPALYTVPWGDDRAKQRWLNIEDWQISQIEEHGAQDGLIGRTAEQTIKLATIRALSRNPKEPRVWEEDVEWGYAVVQRSIDSLEKGAKEHMAGSPFEELCKAILRALHETREGELAQSVLVRKRGVSKSDDRMVKAALDRLVIQGDIYAPAIDGKGVKVRLKTETAKAA